MEKCGGFEARKKGNSFPLLRFLKLNRYFFQLRFERTHLVTAKNCVFRVLPMAKPRGPTAKPSAVLEGASFNNFAAGVPYRVGRFFRTMTKAFLL